MVKSFWNLLKQGASPFLYVLGIIVAIASISSLAQRILDIQLAEYPNTVIGYYRSVADQIKYLLFDWWITLTGLNVKMPNKIFDFLTIWLLLGAASHRGYDGTLTLFSELRTNTPKVDLSRLLKNLALGPLGLKNNLRIFAQFVWPKTTYRKWKKSGGKLSFDTPARKVVMDADEIKTFYEVFRIGAYYNLVFLLAPFFGASFFFLWNWISL